MKRGNWLQVVIRNVIGLTALLLIHYISDRYYLHRRTGFNQISPYIFLLLLYGWIVFHNKILFERLYLEGRKLSYFLWTFSMILFESLNMHFILLYVFNENDSLPKILEFWVYTLAGLGTFIIFKNQDVIKGVRSIQPDPFSSTVEPTHFVCMIDGIKEQIPLSQILYVESLENYIKVITLKKTFIVRLSLKEAEERLPKPGFIRISRSHIVNTSHSVTLTQEKIKVGQQELKIGKVYKRYVEEQLLRRNVLP